MSVYKIFSGYSGVCLNVLADNNISLYNNRDVSLKLDNGSTGQKWDVYSLGNGVRIRSFVDPNFAFNAYRVGSNWNCDVHQVCGNETDSLINIIPAGELFEGLYMIQLANYPSYYLSVDNSVDGGQVFWSNAPDGIYQTWRFVELDEDDSPIPSEYRISCPLDNYYTITQAFKNDQPNQHLGIDYAANQGTPIKAAKDGTVIYTQSWNSSNGVEGWASMGNAVYIQHTDGMTLYMHLYNDPSNYVYVGKNVREGDVIGLVGTTGQSTGNHLHFGYKIDGSFPYNNVNAYSVGTWVDPREYMDYN